VPRDLNVFDFVATGDDQVVDLHKVKTGFSGTVYPGGIVEGWADFAFALGEPHPLLGAALNHTYVHGVYGPRFALT
jgi:hypothetical protein